MASAPYIGAQMYIHRNASYPYIGGPYIGAPMYGYLRCMDSIPVYGQLRCMDPPMVADVGVFQVLLYPPKNMKSAV